jgi:HEPN domain-containing protein
VTTEQDLINFWKTGAADDLATAETLYQNRKNVPALFFCHLALEKGLKAYHVKAIKEQPLPIHDLLHLAKTSNLPLTQEQESLLKEATTFNISARYDNIKLAFHQKATNEYTKNYFGACRDFLLWLQPKI